METEEILARLKKIEGQIRGLQNMIEKKLPCHEILLQAHAVLVAIKKVCAMLVRAHIDECLKNATDQQAKNEKLKELKMVIHRFLDLV